MNPTEIADALERIAQAPYSPESFGFDFAEATDNAAATVAKLRSGTYNKSKLPGGVLLNRKFHFLPAELGGVDAALDTLRADKKTAAHRPAILIATDGATVSAEHLASGERLHCAFAELHEHFGFFLPAAGKERYQPAEENPVDIKATGKLAKLHDALVKFNPDWGSEECRHDRSRFMTRLVFCLFAEDVGIFRADHFSKALFTYGGDRGEHLREVLEQLFAALNRKPEARGGLPSWTSVFRYVNGGLFAGDVAVPNFDRTAHSYLRDACGLNWREINPDIFGSMIQSIARPEDRAELGMHYTSVPNIMKVLGPLFLDEIDTEIEKAWDQARALRRTLGRLGKIRVLDPACGSGNFLVVAYRELRARETKVLAQLRELEGPDGRLWSDISIASFYGIDIDDFAAETAKLSLFIAEYQANARFAAEFHKEWDALPLAAGGSVVCGNALRLDWESLCPPPKDEGDVFIVGNPPFLGDGSRSPEQNAEMDHVLEAHLEAHRRIDYVSCWIFKAAQYVRTHRARSALVSTNSVCQGQSVSALWPHVLAGDIEIGFAHPSFKWKNNASANAAVMCVIVGLRRKSKTPKKIFDSGHANIVANINAYLVDGPDLFVAAEPSSLFSLPCMEYGNKPTDGGNLILNRDERASLLMDYPEAARFLRKFMGSQEVVKGIERYCLWVTDDEVDAAAAIPPIRERFQRVAEFRAASTASQTRPSAEYPHRFRQAQNWARNHALLVPRHSGETREYLPVIRVGADVISSDANMALYDAPEWCLAIIASRLHLVWIATVCGKLESRFRYSNTLGWNTFPVPSFTANQLAALNDSARLILGTRYQHHPKTLAQLYDPDEMPDDLREVHRANDEILESMYIGRPFRNDTERLERLFKLYAARVESRKGATK
jgi:hypothetical protein